MKKILQLSFILFIHIGYSQQKENFEYGIITALSISNVSTNDTYFESKPIIEYKGGFFGNYYLNKKFSIRLKTLYERKGYKGIWYDNIVFNMITVPITANYYFGKNNNWYVNLGPYVGFMIAAKAHRAGSVDITKNYNSMDFGISGGIGLQFPISQKTDLFIEIDNQTGMSDIIKEDLWYSFKNNRMSLNFGIIL